MGATTVRQARPRHNTTGRIVRLAALMALACAVSVPFAATSRAHAASNPLVGVWLGPGDGATNCGVQYDEWWFYGNGQFSETMKSDSAYCADVTFWGTYRLRSGGRVSLYPTGSPCGAYCTPPSFTMSYRLIGKNALALCGYAGARCFTHYRQR